MESFYLIDAWGKEHPLLFCEDLREAKESVLCDYVNTGNRTIIRKTYDLCAMEMIDIDTDYEG